MATRKLKRTSVANFYQQTSFHRSSSYISVATAVTPSRVATYLPLSRQADGIFANIMSPQSSLLPRIYSQNSPFSASPRSHLRVSSPSLSQNSFVTKPDLSSSPPTSSPPQIFSSSPLKSSQSSNIPDDDDDSPQIAWSGSPKTSKETPSVEEEPEKGEDRCATDSSAATGSTVLLIHGHSSSQEMVYSSYCDTDRPTHSSHYTARGFEQFWHCM